MLLGIDIGTSSCKVTLFEINGNKVCSASRDYPVLYPSEGMAEQNPDLWWDSVCCATREVVTRISSPSLISAVGVDGQSWSCIPVDKKGNILANTPIWMDTRSRYICSSVLEQVPEDYIFSVSGNAFSPTYTTPKMLWFKKNRPEIFEKVWKFLQSNSFIVYRLTGEVSQDISQGYGLHFFDVKKLCYDSELATKLGLSVDLVPDIVKCDSVVGTVTKKASLLTGLKEGTPVVAGGLDAACGTLGCGVYKDGDTQEQGGQAGGMSICTSECLSHKKLILSPHVVPGFWLLQGGTVAGGAALNWYSKMWGHGRSFKELDMLASEIEPGSDGVVFLPYLSGERTPLWDPDAKGVFYGFDFSKSEGHAIRAVLEGVAFSLYHNIKVALETGLKPDCLYSMGGAANSKLWTQIKSDVTGCTIKVPCSDEATTLGAAILAGVGSGVYSDYKEAVSETVRITRIHEPNEKNNRIYGECFKKYIKLYPALAEIMHNL